MPKKEGLLKAKNIVLSCVLAGSVALTVARAVPAAPAPAKEWWQNFELGTRSTWVYLTDNKRTLDPANPQAGSFYGSINELDSVHDYWPFKLFVDYKFCTYGGVELAWDYFSARTITRQDGHTDGDLNMRGPLLSAFVRYPADFNLTPYAGAGFAYYKVDFDDNAYWHEPPGRNELQSMDFDHTWGLFVYGGVAWLFAEHTVEQYRHRPRCALQLLIRC